MGSLYKNITGNVATKLDIRILKTEKVKTISLCNVHASDPVTVDVYIYREDKIYNNPAGGEDPTDVSTWGTLDQPDPYQRDEVTGQYANGSFTPPPMLEVKYCIVKNLSIPKAVTFVLQEDELNFNANKYKLYVKLNNSDSAVDLILCTRMKRPEELVKGDFSSSSYSGGSSGGY
tara:strand:- start:10434 stop:10958 length:525 start_codon:yes stop_codon:yes gene_type:complete